MTVLKNGLFYKKSCYYPFSLLFNSAENYWDFLEGNVNVMVFIDFSIVEKISAEYDD
jgi:hypothetical protein